MSLTNNTLLGTMTNIFLNPLRPDDEIIKMLTRLYERFQFMLFCFGLNAKRTMRGHMNYLVQGESGIGTIEMVLILVVLIALVLVFKSRINDLLNDIFNQIDSSAQSVY